MKHTLNQPARSRGFAVLYLAIALTALMGVASLAVDFGRVQNVKSELRAAADAAARYAAIGLNISVAEAMNRAVQAVADNRADGQTIAFNVSTDLEFGIWEPSTGTFTPLTRNFWQSATAVRVTLRRTKAHNNPVPLTFARVVGKNDIDVTAQAIATRGQVIEPQVNAAACPWLAGMPNGAKVAPYGGNTKPAVAPQHSPLLVSGLPLVPGSQISFRQTTGMTSYEGAKWYNADGNTSWIVRQKPDNGINATKAPLNSLVGIFLDDRAPNTYPQAAELDFSTAASRDYTTLSPKLKQVFFIGDGLTSTGQLQKITVPDGATRFYLGIMDEKGWWWDNVGTLRTTMLNNKVALVR